MANRNVDLLIRARDNASRAFKDITKSLGEMDGIQEAAAKSAAKMDTALGKSNTAASAAASTLGKDLAGSAAQAQIVFERIEKTLNDSTAQFMENKAQVHENKEAYRALVAQADAAGAAMSKMRADMDSQIGPATEKQTIRLQAGEAAYKALQTEVNKTAPALAKQEAGLAQNAQELDRVRNAALAASVALRGVKNAGATTQEIQTKAAATKAANDAAAKGFSALAKAEREIKIETDARAEAARLAAEQSQQANQRLVSSVQTLIQSENRLAAIEAQRAKMAAARVVNDKAASGLAGITAGLMSKARADEAAEKAAAAHARAMAALEASYAKQRAAARPSEAQQKALATSFRAAAQAAATARGPMSTLYNEIVRIGPAADNGAKGLNRLAGSTLNGRKAFAAFYGDSRKALSLMQRLRGEVLSLTASFVGFYGVFEFGRSIYDSFTKIEAAQNRLGAAFNQDYAAVNDEMARLQDESARLGISFDVLSDNFSKFLISGQQAGVSTENLRNVFRQVSESGRVLKLTNDQIAGTFNALTQIAGKGTLQMEELRQQLGDRIPGAVGIMAEGLGYGKDQMAEFYKDVENGLVSADRALVAFGGGLEATFGGQLEDALDSTITKVGEFQNLFLQAKVTAANAGFVEGLDKALDSLNKFLASSEGEELFERIGAAFGRAFEMLPVVLDNLDTLGFLLKSFVAIKAGQVIAGLAANFAGMTRVTVGNMRVQVALNNALAAMSPAAAKALVGTNALAVGMRGLRAVIAGVIVTIRAAVLSLGGIIGIAAAALSYFAFTSLTAVDEEAQTASDTLEQHEEILRGLRTAYREAGEGAESYAEKLEKLSKIDAQANISALRKQLDAMRKDDTQSLVSIRGDSSTRRAELFDNVETAGQRQLVQNLLDANEAFEAGTASAGDMLDAIKAINEEAPDLLTPEQLKRIQDYAKAALKGEEDLAKMEAALREMNGEATEADRILLGLVESTEDTGDKATRAADKFQDFKEAMRELGKQVPSLNKELEKFDKIAKIEESFQNALKAANALPDAIMRIAAAQDALKTKEMALGELDAAGRNYEAEYTAGRGTPQGEKMAELVAAAVREGLRLGLNPQDILTAISYETGGSMDPWQKGPTTQHGQHRGLIQWGEPQREQYGVTEFSTISEQMKSVGDYLVDRGVEAGDGLLQIYAAINAGNAKKIHASDANNGGAPGTVLDKVNDQMAGHQSRAGGLLSAYGGRVKSTEDAVSAETRAAEEAAAAQEKRLQAQRDFTEGLGEQIAQTEFLNSLEGQRMIDAEVAKAIKDAENDAAEVGLQLTEQQRAEIEAVTRAKYASKQADEDRNKELEKARALEEQIGNLQTKRQFLLEQITQMEGNGDMVGVARTQEELEGIDAQLEELIQKSIAFWQALGGEGSEAAILALQATQQELQKLDSTAVTTGKQINDMIAGRAAQAFDNFAQRVADGENAVDVFKEEFLSMAADILRQIGMMIIKQLIFNAISGLFGGGAGGGGGLGGMIAGGINKIFHAGGVVNGSAPSSSRRVSPAIFANARRYHSGGIAGLAPDEMGAILKKNEEVLTEADPRHRFNGGATGGNSAPPEMTIVNAFDAPGFLESAISTTRGKSAFVNFIKANSDTVKAALG